MHARGLGARREPVPLAVPQVQLPVDAADAGSRSTIAALLYVLPSAPRSQKPPITIPSPAACAQSPNSSSSGAMASDAASSRDSNM